MSETRYPLCWPEGWKRISNRESARFGRQETVVKHYQDGSSSTRTSKKELSVNDGIWRVLGELRRMGVQEGDAIISTNVAVRLDGLPYSNRSEPADPGVAVYWKDSKGRKKCMAVDRYDRVADNIAAIAATLDAMRSIERHGGAEILERTFLGFAQLPERTGKSWREILGFGEDETPTEAILLDHFRSRAAEAHPDTGGDHERMVLLTSAKREALQELRKL